MSVLQRVLQYVEVCCESTNSRSAYSVVVCTYVAVCCSVLQRVLQRVLQLVLQRVMSLPVRATYTHLCIRVLQCVAM